MLDVVFGVIGTILYPLFSIVFVVLDMLQSVFRSFAGIGNIYFGTQRITGANDGTETGSGLIYYLLTSSLVKNLLISIATLALFLLIIFTVLAFIRNAYSTKPKSWQEIVGNAFRGLANFVFIPVMCLLGVWLGNVLLNAIDGATSTGGSTRLSRKLFIACSYNANDYRLRDDNPTKDRAVKVYEIGYGSGTADWIEDDQTKEYYAQIVDDVYAQTSISIYDWGYVEVGYALYSINYLFLAIAGGFMCYVLINVVYGMIKRMFMLVILFVISPALCAMYPLDEGKAVGSWKSDFIKQTISAYGAVAGMNLFMSIMPLIEKISFAGQAKAGTGSMTDYLIQLLILISGLFVVKELIGKLSGYVGGEDAFSAGSSLRSSTKGALKKAGGKVTSVASAFSKAAGASRAGGAAGFFGSLARQAGDAGMKNVLGLDVDKIGKGYREGLKDTQQRNVDRQVRDIMTQFDSGAITQNEALNRAKTLGVEKTVADMVAEQLNIQEIRHSRADRNYVPVNNTADSILADQKAVKEYNDAIIAMLKRAESANDDDSIFTKVNFSATDSANLGFASDADRNNRMRSGNRYTDMDISSASTDAMREAMIRFNAAIDEMSNRVEKFESAVDAAEEKAKATSKLTHSGFNENYMRSTGNNQHFNNTTLEQMFGQVKGDIAGILAHVARDGSGNITGIDVAAADVAANTALANMQDLAQGLRTTSDALNNMKTQMMRNSSEVGRRNREGK